jgi:hypothetical protein
MSDQEPVNASDDRDPNSDERLPWSPPALTDLGTVSEMTKGISYQPSDGLSNLTP